MTTYKLKLHTLFVFFFNFIAFETANALLCYTCNYSEGQNKTCLLYPDEVRVTNCNKKYCTIMRQEAANSPDRVISFRRGCEDKPQFLDKVVVDSDFTTYFRSCKKDKCNYKKGNEVNSANSVGAAPNGIMGGKNNTGHRRTLSGILFILTGGILWLQNVYK